MPAPRLPVDSYLRPDHPLQQEIASIIAACCGAPPGAISLGTDGCGVPTFYVALHQAARAFAVLADPRDLPDPRAAAFQRIGGAMRRHPLMVGGTGRFNTQLQHRLGDRLICKGGAEAIFGIGLVERGWGVAVKIADGNARALGAAVIETLAQLGVVTGAEVESLGSLHRPVILNHRGWEVGEIRPVLTLEKVS